MGNVKSVTALLTVGVFVATAWKGNRGRGNDFDTDVDVRGAEQRTLLTVVDPCGPGRTDDEWAAASVSKGTECGESFKCFRGCGVNVVDGSKICATNKSFQQDMCECVNEVSEMKAGKQPAIDVLAVTLGASEKTLESLAGKVTDSKGKCKLVGQKYEYTKA